MAGKPLTYEEAIAIANPNPSGRPAPAAPRALSYEEAIAMPRDGNGEARPGFLANSGDDGWWSSAGKGAATAVIKGLGHIPGIAGDARDLIAMGTGAVQSIPYVGNGRNLLDNIGTQVQAARNLPGIGMIPNGESFSNPVLRQTGEYQPESGAGRAAMAGIEAITGGINPVSLARSGVKTALREMTTVPNMVIAGTAGAAGDVVGHETGNPLLGAAAGAGAGALAAVAGNTGRAIRASRSDAGRAENVDRIVGQIGRQGATDPNAALANLDAHNAPRPGADVPGVRLTAPQAADDGGLGGLAARANAMDENGGAAQTTARQIAESERVLANEAARVADANTQRSPDVDVRAGYGISGQNPQGAASEAARDAFAQLENARHAQQSAAWQAPELGNTALYRRRSIAQINDFIDGLGEVRGQQFPADIRKIIASLDQPGASSRMPFQELQDLRSAILTKSRNARNSPDPVNTKDLDGLAQRIAEVMTDKSNVQFGDVRGAIPAWERARDLTRRYYEDFPARGIGGKLAADGKIAPDATIESILSGRNGPQNLRDLQAISGLDITPHVSDWAVARLTGNGERVVSPQDVSRFMAEPKNAAIIAQVPGLDMRLQQIALQSGESAQMAAQRQAAGLLSTAVGQGPEQILRVIQRNRDAIVAGAAGGDRQAVNALEASARKLASLPGSGPSGTATLDALQDGRLLEIIMGKATGKIASGAAGAVAGKAAGAITGMPGIETAGGMLGGVLGMKGKNLVAEGTNKLINAVFFGTTQEEAVKLLQRAVNDPELMATLMKKPSPETIKSFGDLTGRALQGAGPGAYQGARTGAQSGINELVVNPPPRMAAGGFVADVARQAVQHFEGGGGPVKGALGALAKIAARGLAREEAPAAPYVIKRTLPETSQNAFPGIYKDPRVIADEALARVAPEDPALKQLFGVTRDDMYEATRGRVGNREPDLKMAPNPKGSAAVDRIMTPANERRLQDILYEGDKRAGALSQPMGAWYYMDPAYEHVKRLLGSDAPRSYTQFNALTGMASPGSDVLTEINRGTAANWLATHGRFEDFVKHGGKAGSGPPDMAAVKGHPYHSTSQAGPMATFLEKGYVDMASPKVPLYIQSSSPTELGFQTKYPVPDAHLTRGVGLSDTRTNKDFAASMSMPEFQAAAPWFEKRVAAPSGRHSVEAQGQVWGLLAPQTGVESPIGAPKLELLAIRIMDASKRLGISPEAARDLILTGGGHAGIAATAGAGALGAYAASKDAPPAATGQRPEM
jgi:hypothetical protein